MTRHRWSAMAAVFVLVLGGATATTTMGAEGPWTWRPVADSITAGPAADGAGLHVWGRMEAGWNYVASNREAVVPGGLYRLSARLRVARLGPGTPAPYLKCEFIPEKPGPSLQVHTRAYEIGRMETWQELTVEFRVPEAARSCWLALEKGTNTPTEIDATLADVRLEPIARLSALERSRLKPLPPSLEATRGVHPRLYLTADRVALLKTAIKTTHAAIWDEVRARADRAVRSGPPKYVKDDGHSGDEQLWQRNVGNVMPLLAIAHALTGEKAYLDAARSWALASCGYPTWGLGRVDGMDLAAGHQLFGLAMVYDWCYADLDAETRRTIRETLARRASAMYRAAALGETWWSRSYMQNHLWVDTAGMAAAGFALFDEEDEAAGWIGLPLETFRQSMDSLGPDGASHEGVGYWEYGVEYLLKFSALARDLLGVELTDNEWWRNTSKYALHMTLPRRAWTPSNCIVDIADCPRSHWYGPDYLLRELARLNHDGHAQWLAAEVDAANVAAEGASWLNLLWFDPAVVARPPTDLPTLHHFADMGLVSARTDWSGDESLVVAKCGPFLGHAAVEKFSYDPGGGHVHPDANHFVVFGAGEWLIRDDGYRAKWTGQHNTLLIDDRGQMGEGEQWFQGAEALRAQAQPKIVRVRSTPELDHWTGSAAAAYAPELGLKNYVRHWIFLKPDALVVVDDVQTEKASNLELRLHPEAEPEVAADAGVVFARGSKAVLRIEPLTADGVEVRAERVSAAGRTEEKRDEMATVRLIKRGDHWRNAVALSWSAAGVEPVVVTLKRDGDRWAFAAGDRRATLDWSTGEAR